MEEGNKANTEYDAYYGNVLILSDIEQLQRDLTHMPHTSISEGTTL